MHGPIPLTVPPPGQATRLAQPTAGAALGFPRGPWVWFLLMPLFFQIYHYKAEAGPLYYLSKVWPVLLAPLVLLGLVSLRMRDGVLYLLLLAYALAVPPVLSMLYLPNGLTDALLSGIKSWPLAGYFSLGALLMLLAPSEAAVKRGMLAFGGATYALMLLLWAAIPADWYQPGVGEGGNMFSWDDGRGAYIRMPMMLGVLFMLWLAHRFIREGRLWQILLAFACLLSIVFIYKARLPTLVCALILLLILSARIPPRWRWGLGALAMVPAAAAAMVVAPRVPALLGQIFDASFFIRLQSSAIALDWIMSSPAKLIFGSGSTSSFSPVSMADFFGYRDFWLTDIGWLGVLFEYGVIGTALIAAIHWRALASSFALRHGSAFRGALFHYVLFEVMCSPVYSVMYAVGPVVGVAAIAWWLRLRDKAGMGEDQAGWPGGARFT